MIDISWLAKKERREGIHWIVNETEVQGGGITVQQGPYIDGEISRIMAGGKTGFLILYDSSKRIGVVCE